MNPVATARVGWRTFERMYISNEDAIIIGSVVWPFSEEKTPYWWSYETSAHLRNLEK